MGLAKQTMPGFAIFSLVGLFGLPLFCADTPDASRDDAAFFEKSVRPLLIAHCIKCHGAEKQEGGLRLDSQEGLLKGGESGPAIQPGALDKSRILSAVRYEELEMPPTGRLPDEKIDALSTWISRGAHWPKSESGGGVVLRKKSTVTDEDRQYWAFQPLKKPAVPVVRHSPQADRVRNDVDCFILSKLQSAGLTLAPEANPTVQVRRLYFDLLGVPPSPAEMEAFLDDPRGDAYERLVDKLLDDPRYGQRWARHWLDLVRYAESDGYKQDAYRPTAFLYRDYVIDALNRDMPYDQFVHEQLAGDEIDNRNPTLLAATGYLRHWIYEYNQRDVRAQWSSILNDLTDVTGDVFFGLGFGCARCHDHKFDPIMQKDYYRLQASFAGILPNDSIPHASADKLDEHREQLAKWESATSEIRREMSELEAPPRRDVATKAIDKFPPEVRPWLTRMGDQRTPLEKQIAELAFRQVKGEWDALDFQKSLKGKDRDRWVELKEQLAKFDEIKPDPLPSILAASDVGPEAPPVFLPKSADDREPIEPATMEVLGGKKLAAVAPVDGRSTGRRTALANWINSPENPLPHRVIVNRVWQYHFGTGLVGNASDFGRLGTLPAHPELLDWLSVWFLENGRSLKKLHRLLATAATYRQASRHPEHELCRRIDNANHLWWHFPARRLDAEQVRDSMLAVSGAMDWSSGGPASPHDSHRRTVYTKVMRNTPNPLLNVMDGPDGSSSVARRNVTTTAVQSLLLANSPWPIQLGKHMALNLVKQSASPQRQIELAYLRAFQRSPSVAEIERAMDFMQLQSAAARNEAAVPQRLAVRDPAEDKLGDVGEHAARAARNTESVGERNQPDVGVDAESDYLAALGDFCHVLLNSSEFLYIE